MRDRPLSRAIVIATLFAIAGLLAVLLIPVMASVGDGDERGVTHPDTAAGAQPVPAAPPPRVEVLNGAGKAGLARSATQRLRGEGFDVVFFGNAGRFDHARSVVLDRSGDREAALAVAATLGIDSVEAVPDASLLLDVSVILGSDWPPAPIDEATHLDRLRRYLTPGDPGT